MRYRVELEELLAFVEKLEAFEQRAEALAAHVDGQVADLHSSWSGEAADTHLSGHDRWMAAAAQMRESLGELRQTAQAAHRNYREAVQAQYRDVVLTGCPHDSVGCIALGEAVSDPGCGPGDVLRRWAAAVSVGRVDL